MAKVRAASQVRQAEAAKDVRRKLNKDRKRHAELDTIIKKLYESFAVGRITDTEMKQVEGKLSKMTDYLEKMKAQQPKLSSQLAVDAKNFAEIKERVSSQQEDTLFNARVSLRDDSRDQVRSKLRETFGQKFEYDRLASAEQRRL